MFCMYGIQFEKDENRIQKLAKTHPKQYKYCTEGGTYNEDGQWIPCKGLGLGHVLDIMNIEWRVDSDKDM